MNFAIFIELLIRLVPTLLLCLCAYLTTRDETLGRHWANFMVSTGTIPAARKEEPKVRAGVRIPLLVLAGIMLIWPAMYYLRDSYAQTQLLIAPIPTARPTAKPTPKGAQVVLPTPTPGLTPIAPISQDGVPNPGPAAPPAAMAPLPAPAAPAAPVAAPTARPTPPPAKIH